MDSMTERFQVTLPVPKSDPDHFVMPSQARKSSGGARNQMPVGDMIEGADLTLVQAGIGDVTEINHATGLRDGFQVLPMGGADDMYTGEHVDHFYGDVGGFVERNNYLDRE